MALTQQRPYQADLYVEETVPSDELMYLVDHESFDRPKRQPYSNFGGGGATSNVQRATLTNLISRTISQSFSQSFTSIPVTVQLKVYRYVQQGSGYVEEPVLFTYPSVNWKTLTGFSINIDDDESLTGVYIEYYFA